MPNVISCVSYSLCVTQLLLVASSPNPAQFIGGRELPKPKDLADWCTRICDPSLRLKNGSAQDDSITKDTNDPRFPSHPYAVFTGAACPSPPPNNFWRPEKKSTGTGKITVVFFSTPISVRVCKYRNCTLTGSVASR